MSTGEGASLITAPPKPVRNPLPRPAVLGITAAILLVVWGLGWLLISVGVLDAYVMSTLTTICINIILAVSLNLIVGFTGQLSLGHAGFMAIGAYTCALITMPFSSAFPDIEIVGFILGLIGGGLAAGVVGVAIGVPTLRLKGDYLAIATLGLAQIIMVVLQNLEITNGAAGLSGIPSYVDWNWLFLLTAGTILLVSNLLGSAQGRDIVAVREDEIAASAVGVNTTRVKILAFTVGGIFAGIAGGLYASSFYVIQPQQFSFMLSINILVIVVLGGLGSLTGSVLGAIVLGLVSTFLQSYPEIQMILYSLILVLLMLFRPQGLLGNREFSVRALGRILPIRTKKESKA
ncbi:branched-chain amino acid ABC transporter permease [Granulicoccus phenolivorans]|uniref:branched-chain amino acid ABC transporter permease n=1 Tax=Granulicoccus phenolivorans TaxID=266854 RepID=UPI000427F5CD|nr:branched-chain amino acid ABC transporter permease [Granulicoccus phenolivorans]